MVNRIVNPPPIRIQNPVQKTHRNHQAQEHQSPDILQKRTQFGDIFREKLDVNQRISFSAHASSRMMQRDIQLTENDLNRLEGAVDKIAEKGGRESLIMMDDISYVVSIQNKKVITAMDSSQAKDNIFTNIDSAIIVR